MKLSWPNFDSYKSLSADEVAELAARIGELTKAGMPLGEGLRAVAAELPGRRLPRTVRRLADRFDAGGDVATALQAQGRRLPEHFVGLLLAGIRTGRLAEMLEEFVDLERSRQELRRRLWMAFAYPLFLLVVLAGTAVVIHAQVEGFRRIFAEFGTELPDMTRFFFATVGPVTWLLVATAILAVVAPLVLQVIPRPAWLSEMLQAIPMLGPVLRWSRLAQFSRLIAVLLEQQVPLPDALRLAAAGVNDSYLAQGCRRVAAEVEAGRPLAESMKERPQFPPTLIPLVRWGQQTPALADAFRAAAEMFQGRVFSQGSLLQALLLPVTLLLIISMVGFFVIAMFLPLICLIQKLSG